MCFNQLICFLSLVLLLLGDPLRLRSGCSDLGFHEQRHSEQHTLAFISLSCLLTDFSAPVPMNLLRLFSQISKELINFYDSAYIKAVDVSGSPSKDAAIKVLDVFHNTVRHDGKSLTWQKLSSDHVSWTALAELFVSALGFLHSSTAAVKEMTLRSSDKSPAPCVPGSLQQIS